MPSLFSSIKEFVSVLLYYFDIGSDIATIYVIFDGSKPFAALLITFLCFRLLVQSVVAARYTRSGSGCSEFFRNIFEVDMMLSYVFPSSEPKRVEPEPDPNVIQMGRRMARPQQHQEPPSPIDFDKENFEAILESAPSLVIQTSIYLFTGLAPNGFDSIATLITSISISIASLAFRLSELWIGHAMEGHHVPIYQQLVIFCFVLMEVSFRTLTAGLISVKIQEVLVMNLGWSEQKADEALILGMFITVVGLFVTQMIFLRCFLCIQSHGMGVIETVTTAFSSIPLSREMLAPFFGRFVFSSCLTITIGVYNAVTQFKDKHQSKKLSFIGVASLISLGTWVIDLILLFFIGLIIRQIRRIGPNIKTTRVNESIDSSSTRNLGIFLRLIAVIAILTGVVVYTINSANTSGDGSGDQLLCDGFGPSLAAKIFQITQFRTIDIYTGCLLQDLASVRHVAQFIKLHSGFQEAVFDFPSLTYIGSHLQIPDFTGTRISLPLLNFIGYYLLIISDNALTMVVLPALTSVEDYISIGSSPSLTYVSLTSLAFVGGSFTLLSGLTSISFPALTFVGGSLSLSSSTTSYSLPSLTFVGGDIDIDISSLAFVSVSSLAFVGGSFYFSGSSLASVSVSALSFVGSHFSIYYNPSLASISFPALTFIGGDVRIYGNAASVVVVPSNIETLCHAPSTYCVNQSPTGDATCSSQSCAP